LKQDLCFLLAQHQMVHIKQVCRLLLQIQQVLDGASVLITLNKS